MWHFVKIESETVSQVNVCFGFVLWQWGPGPAYRSPSWTPEPEDDMFYVIGWSNLTLLRHTTGVGKE
jgi:hypothetical protein